MQSLSNVKLKIALKEYLASLNVTPYMLGKWVTGVSPQTIFAVTNGTRKPSLDVLEAIINALRTKGHPATPADIIKYEAQAPEQDIDH